MQPDRHLRARGVGALRVLVLLLSTALISGCGQPPTPAGTAAAVQSGQGQHALTVYKSPTCGCCGDWVTHMRDANFEMAVVDREDLSAVKAQFGIERGQQSCHTAVWNEGEYVFEGHIPAHLVEQFLAEKPAGARGLTVPGMPMGSPGMEMGDRFQPYAVLLIERDGSTRTYATITTQAQQYR